VSDMAGEAARVAVERSGKLPRYNADQLSTALNSSGKFHQRLRATIPAQREWNVKC
jgi:hypothetical protein